MRRVNVTAGEEVKRHWVLAAEMDEEKESDGEALACRSEEDIVERDMGRMSWNFF